MKTKQVTRYICEHCDKKMYLKWAMERHESICPKNPVNARKCMKCEHLHKMDNRSYFCGHPSKDQEGYPTMHTLTAVKRGLLQKYPASFVDSTLMPTICELYEDKHALTDSPF